jgi:hypothetical protein
MNTIRDIRHPSAGDDELDPHMGITLDPRWGSHRELEAPTWARRVADARIEEWDKGG